MASNVTRHPQIVGAVIYSSAGQDHSDLATASLPQVHHLSGKLAGLPQRTKQVTQYEYAGRASCAFATPFHQDFDHASESISHSRNLAFFKPLMGGPYFDLEAIWDEHVYYEFEVRSVESTMNTMVQEPYVNHVPTVRPKAPLTQRIYTSCGRSIIYSTNDRETSLPVGSGERSSRHSTAIISSSRTRRTPRPN